MNQEHGRLRERIRAFSLERSVILSRGKIRLAVAPRGDGRSVHAAVHRRESRLRLAERHES